MHGGDMSWMGKTKKRKHAEIATAEEDGGDEGISLPLVFPKMGGTTIYSHMNHVYFNDEINAETIFALNKELRQLETKMRMLQMTHGVAATPIYLHLTTDGGSIHSAFSAVDCIQSLRVPVYTVVDGFVASAGTLISLAAQKRFIRPNAYMLIHELRSGVWGKMSAIEEEVENLKKIMTHIRTFYQGRTKLTKKQLETVLTKDAIWNADECMQRGIVDGVYQENQ